MMRGRLIAAACLCAATIACQKEKIENVIFEPNGPVDPGIIEKELTVYDRSFDVVIPEVVCYTIRDASVVSPAVTQEKCIDMHVEVLPIYAFGAQDGVSGDYYAVNGYVVAHNAKVFADDNILVHSPYNEQIRRTGWYMSQLSVGLQLLDKDGKAVDNQNVTFFVTPEPSTTIGSTTYKKGFSFSLAPSVTLGSIKKEGTEDEEPTWKKIRMGCVNFGFNWENSSTQDIPDQSVVMSTGPQDRSVSLSLLTNNVKDAIGKSAIPAIAYSDQRFDFSFVWHVDEGSYCAKKGGFGNMTMKMKVNPKYKSSYSGEFHYTPEGSDVPPENKKDASVKYYESYNKIQQELSLSETVKLPGINRIPTGYVNIKNTTRNYLTKISLWRTGEYDSNKTDAYLAIKGSYDTNQSVKSITRVGHYDLVYELVNGDTGESRGMFIIKDFEITENMTKELSTMDGTRL